MTWTLLRSFNNSSALSLDDPEFREYLKGKRVLVTYQKDGENLTVEGEISKCNAQALLLELGRNRTRLLLEREWLIRVEEKPPVIVVPKIIIRQLGPVTDSTVRQHLADRHGFLLNQMPDDPLFAVAVHQLHHENNLAHRHGEIEPALRGMLTPEEVARRAAELDGLLICHSCGYERRPEQDGRMFHTLDNGVDLHCDECKDETEFSYE